MQFTQAIFLFICSPNKTKLDRRAISVNSRSMRFFNPTVSKLLIAIILTPLSFNYVLYLATTLYRDIGDLTFIVIIFLSLFTAYGISCTIIFTAAKLKSRKKNINAFFKLHLKLLILISLLFFIFMILTIFVIIRIYGIEAFNPIRHEACLDCFFGACMPNSYCTILH